MQQATGRQVWNGADAVNLAEERICRRSPVDAVEVAEGLASTGLRAATRLNPSSPDPAVVGASGEVPWVHHARRSGSGDSGGTMAFELVAADVQEAIDHCLIGHRIASEIGRAGACTVDPQTARAMEPADLPGERALAALAPVKMRGSLGEIADRAFDDVSAATGRRVRALESGGLSGARFVVLGVGTAALAARTACEALQREGIACGWIRLGMVHPLPVEALRRCVNDVSEIAIVDVAGLGDGASAREPSWVTATRMGLCRPGEGPRIHRVPAGSCGEVPALLRDLGTEFKLSSDVVERLCERFLSDGNRRLVLTALPGGPAAEEFLVDCAQTFLNRAELKCERAEGAIAAGSSIGIRRGAGEIDGRRLADLLVASDPALLDPETVIAGVRTEGTIVVADACESPGRFWKKLSGDQRDALTGRSVRLRLFDVTALDPQVVRLGLRAAVAGSRCWSRLLDGPSEDLSCDAFEGKLHDLEPASMDDPVVVSGETGQADLPPVELTMPAAPKTSDSADELRDFCRRGAGKSGQITYPPARLLPAAFRALCSAPSEDVELEPGDAFGSYLEALGSERRPRRREFVDEVRRLATRLEAMVESDAVHEPGADSAGALAAALGATADRFVNPEALAANLPPYRGTERLEPERLNRIRWAIESLRAGVETLTSQRELIVVTSRAVPAWLEPAELSKIEHLDPPAAATGVFVGCAEKLRHLFGAVRIARLELNDLCTDAIYTAIQERFDWRAFDEDERRLLPQVTVLESAARLRGPLLGSLSRLLSSGYPIHVWALDRPELHASSLGRLAAAFEGVFVLESTPVRRDELIEGCRSMVTQLGAAFAVVPQVSWPASFSPWTQWAAVESARVRAASDVTYVDPSGCTQVLPQVFTLAHVLAIDPASGHHFLPIEVGAWASDQLDLHVYMESDAEVRRHSIPFVWIERGDGSLARAIVSRELAQASRDHAGDPCPADAVEAPPEVAIESPALSEPLPPAPSIEQTMQRLVLALMDPDAASRVENGETPVQVSVEAVAPTEPQPEPTSDSQVSIAVVTDPYIDTILCTTCQDCININPRMFRYNDDKQAFIADASQGTYAQLVKAAEKCPARCIHPGRPSAGDATGTEAMITRAAPFNG